MNYAVLISVFLCVGLLAINHGRLDLFAILLGASLAIFAAWNGICHMLDGLFDRPDEFVEGMSPSIDVKRDGR